MTKLTPIGLLLKLSINKAISYNEPYNFKLMDKNKAGEKKTIANPKNDGTNTPVPDRSAVRIVPKSEAKLLRQARNPLGDPDKV
jgi:hypothetical protein